MNWSEGVHGSSRGEGGVPNRMASGHAAFISPTLARPCRAASRSGCSPVSLLGARARRRRAPRSATRPGSRRSSRASPSRSGKIFLRLLFMLVIPLLLTALPLGVAGLGDLRSLGPDRAHDARSTPSPSRRSPCCLGVGLVNLFEPGTGLSPELKERLARGAPGDAADGSARPAPSS